MRFTILLVTTAAAAMVMDPSSLSLLLPTTAPNAPEDWWPCATKDFSQHLNPPRPTGAFSSALMSYGREIIGPCTEVPCPFPDATKWCGFATDAPVTQQPAYTSYASSASAWWGTHSSAAMSLAKSCPWYWYGGLMRQPDVGPWLNVTIILGECIAKSPSDGTSARSTALSTTSLGTTILSSRASSSVPPVQSSPTEKVSPDGTCGGTTGYMCAGSGFGDCCSSYGWCGSQPAHCDDGCQIEYGTCKAASKVSPDGTCGGVAGYTCEGSGFGDCCSSYGWCGSELGHCGNGCQPTFGVCSSGNGLTVRAPVAITTGVVPSRAGLATYTALPTTTNQPNKVTYGWKARRANWF